ncbi:MAG: hypothetical protein RDU30_04945 [Desulfovibrionaceae bacterium]|nr:hypothetical protein [Desulfovibrionaceae bacterium]
MIDYGEVLPRLEKALGLRYRDNPDIINVPGTSVACKVDPFAYVAPRPAFVAFLAKWAGTPLAVTEETLVRTGNLLVDASHARLDGPVAILVDGSPRVMRMPLDFIPASFIDRALVLYGGEHGPLPVSRLRLLSSEKARIDAFFSGKPPLLDVAYASPG